MNKTNVLFLVEGAKTEPRFFEQLKNSFNLNLNIVCLQANIYSLYNKLKFMDFNADLKIVLAEMIPEYKEILSQKFAYTYLVFDCDVQHSKKNEERSIQRVAIENVDKLLEMATFFTDETDPTKGKLYINYPMMESYRDADSFFDDKYSENFVSIEDLTKYKKFVSKKKLANYRVDAYCCNNFTDLAKMNVYKLNKMINDKWAGMSYTEYREKSAANLILAIEKNYICKINKIAVLNTSLFFILDYFGNENNFYDSIIV